MMKLLSALVGLMLAAVLPVRAADHGFEGRFELRVQNAEGTRVIPCAMKPDFLRVELPSAESGKLVSLADFARGEVALLMPGQPLYAAMPVRDAVAKLGDARQTQIHAPFQKTTDTLVLLGQPCVKYIAKDKDGVTEAWMVSGFGSPHAIAALQPLARGAVERDLLGRGGFPMCIIGKAPDGTVLFRMDVVSLEKLSLADSVFMPPASYHKLDLGGLSSVLGGL